MIEPITTEVLYGLTNPCKTQQKTYCGIDPGKSGSLCFISGETIDLYKMPLIKGKEIDAQQIRFLLIKHDPILTMVEKVSAMPGNGVAGMFRFGEGFGLLQGILAGLQYPYELVTPQRWKAVVLKGTRKDKAAAISYCQRRHPEVSLVPLRSKKISDGFADALCLAEYAKLSS